MPQVPPLRTPSLLAGVTVLLAGIVLAAVPVPAAPVAVFLLAAPALAVAVPWRGSDVLARTVVAVTVSLALNGLVAEVLLAAGLWSPRAAIPVVAAASAAIWIVVGVTTSRQSRHRAEETA